MDIELMDTKTIGLYQGSPNFLSVGRSQASTFNGSTGTSKFRHLPPYRFCIFVRYGMGHFRPADRSLETLGLIHSNSFKIVDITEPEHAWYYLTRVIIE